MLETFASFVKLLIAARGRVAQLGERIVRNDEVAGSIPVSSTKLLNQEPKCNLASTSRGDAMADRRGHMDERLLLIVLTLMVAFVLFRLFSHIFGR